MISFVSKDVRKTPADSEYSLQEKQLMEKKQTNPTKQLYRKPCPATLPNGAQAFGAELNCLCKSQSHGWKSSCEAITHYVQVIRFLLQELYA